MTNESAGHIGGVERQIALMARWLAGRGHDVSVVVWDEAQATETMVDRIRILPVCRRSAGIPGLRFFTPRWTSLVRALRTADA
ncbi:MAG TPA: glycosyltransferase, partial [Hyphomicrobiales bacterium]|nr:glycosyltransferase [Hyphomicrobiales bacterium]